MLGYHRICRRKLLALAAPTLALFTATPSLSADLVLKRVLLGTGGVGYFEYAADIDASDVSLQLRARLDQVDDILKSLIVIDPAGAATATLPGKAGASEAFADEAAHTRDSADLVRLDDVVGVRDGPDRHNSDSEVHTPSSHRLERLDAQVGWFIPDVA
jgi:hypothetical protein